MKCLECDKETNNPKFCNNSCAAKYNNRNREFKPSEDKRIKLTKCKECQKEIEVNIRSSLNNIKCEECKIKNSKCQYKCGQNAKYKLNNGKFCCSESYNRCLKVKEKNSKGVKLAYDENRKGYTYNPKSNWIKNSEKGKELIQDIIKRNFVKNSAFSNVKEYYIEYIVEEYKCEVCNLTDWQNDSINLHLDHINGDRFDNRIENLRLLCPNCHSQTFTYCGRNVNNGKYKATDEELIEAIKNNKNIYRTLISLGMAPKGANYNRVYKILEEYNLEFKN